MGRTKIPLPGDLCSGAPRMRTTEKMRVSMSSAIS